MYTTSYLILTIQVKHKNLNISNGMCQVSEPRMTCHSCFISQAAIRFQYGT